MSEATPRETWKDIPGYEGLYSVSDQGRVKSLARLVRSGTATRSVRERVRHITHPGDTYSRIRLSGGAKGTATKLVHQLVMLAFVGPLPEGEVTRHLNSTKTDNRLINLCYGTQAENMQDAREAGTLAEGSRVGGSKLAEEDVLSIRRRNAEGERAIDLADEYGVTKSTMSALINRKTWRHI